MKNTLDSHLAAYGSQNQFDFDNRIMLNWYSQRIIKYTENAKSLLELGLGHGFSTNVFSNRFERHVVLEGSAAVIENFRKTFPDCHPEIIETFFENFMSYEKFDVIVMGFILEHVDNPFETITRFKQFLAPDGKLFVAVPNAEVLNRRLGYIAGLLPDIQKLSENDILLGHKRFYTVHSLIELVGSAKYKIERMEGIYLKPFTSEQMASLKFDKNIMDALCEVGAGYPELSLGILIQLKVV
jgi:trans-aconitate methyltransferase